MVKESTEAIIDEQGVILFPAPNDGSISSIIDVNNIKVHDGKIEYEERFYHIVGENGIAYSLTLIGTEKLKAIFDIFNAQLAQKSRELEESEARTKRAAEIISKNKRALMDANRVVTQMREENEKYKSLYGNFSNPYLILQELYKSGRVGKFRQLIKPEAFRQKSINTKNKKNREPVQYWLALFELWEILDSEGNIRYAKVSYEKAKKILKEKLMKNENIGYVNDFIICKGENGTGLETTEEEEVTEWYKEQLEK